MADSFLVTGAAGFIGNHVALKLLEQGRRVVGLDNFNDYYDVALKEARHARLEAYPEYRGVRGDLCDYPLLQHLFGEEKFAGVIHLAAQAGVRYSVDHPFTYLRSNLEGFLGILEACRHAEVPRLVYASSSSVYGSNTDLPFSETDRVDHPLSLYGATKRSNELMAHAYSHLYGMQTIGLRFFTVYGPWGRPDMAMWIFAERIVRGEPIPVFNHGKMRRDFTYIDDIVNGVFGALFTPDLASFEVFNLGNHRCEELMEVIGLIETALGRKAELNLLPMQPGDVPATYADVSQASARLGFSPATTIHQGVPNFIDWFQEFRTRSD